MQQGNPLFSYSSGSGLNVQELDSLQLSIQLSACHPQTNRQNILRHKNHPHHTLSAASAVRPCNLPLSAYAQELSRKPSPTIHCRNTHVRHRLLVLLSKQVLLVHLHNSPSSPSSARSTRSTRPFIPSSSTRPQSTSSNPSSCPSRHGGSLANIPSAPRSHLPSSRQPWQRRNADCRRSPPLPQSDASSSS